MKGIVITTDGEVQDFEFERESSLDTFQHTVGGYIEDIPQNFHSKATIYACEEGKINNLPLNKLATFLSGLYPQDYVVGDVIVVGAVDEQGWDTTLPDEVIEAVKSIDVEATWENYLRAIENAGVKTALVRERRDG